MRVASVSMPLALTLAVCLAFDAGAQGNTSPPKTWSASQISVIEGFRVPECVLADPATGNVYVSNIDAVEDAYWNDDEAGHISLLNSDGDVRELKWLQSAPENVINAPKGMCIRAGYLYFTDNARLMRRNLAKEEPPREVPLPQAKRLNDLASDGEFVFVSDTVLGIIYKIGADGKAAVLKSPESPNGVACWKGKVFAVSWDLHDVFEIDPSGNNAPVSFGLAAHFTNLDGIEVLDDGSFIVSDFVGNKVSLITPDRKTVTTLAELDTPADIGLDPTRGLLYVPQFMKDRVAILRLTNP